jgi:hypothetical protein
MLPRGVMISGRNASLRGAKRRSNPVCACGSGLLRFARNDVSTPRIYRLLAFLLIATLVSPALAQDQPKSLKTIKIREPAPGMDTLYAIDEDGTVRIDWPAVETLATSKADRTVLPLAQLMLAIRDGTWKPAR